MVLTRELIDEIVPKIDPNNPYPIDEKKHHCEYSIMKDRERIRAALFELIVGVEP